MSTIFLKTTNYKNFVSLKKFTHAHLFQIALKIMIVYANIFAFDGKMVMHKLLYAAWAV